MVALAAKHSGGAMIKVVALTAACVVAAWAASAEDQLPSFSARGLIELRLVAPDNTLSWEQKGLGKTRYGGEPNVIGRLAEASVILQSKITWDLSAVAHLTANTQQKNAVDVVEAFLSYRPAPTSEFGIRGRAGAFFPPISLENTNLAWTSPYTISSSAINSWVGEELRSVGAEFTAFRQTEQFTLSVLASGFYFNDPAGTVLAWRGWAIHDREAGLFERLALPNVRIVRPGARLQRQAPYIEPLKELDSRMAYYIGARLEHEDWGELRVMFYDNPGDDRELTNGQWPWRTKFISVGAKTSLPGDIDLVAQAMDGRTTVVTIPGLASPIVKTGFSSVFGLISKSWDQHRISARAEYFETKDKDVLFPDNNNEWGTGLTLAYVYRPTDSQRMTAEFLHIHSNRPERTLSFGLPSAVSENQVQLSYRYIF
jgi:hypothetical protein